MRKFMPEMKFHCNINLSKSRRSGKSAEPDQKSEQKNAGNPAKTTFGSE